MSVATRVACMRWQRICSAEVLDISISCIGMRGTVIVLLEFTLAEYHAWVRCLHTPYVALHICRYSSIDDTALIIDWSRFG
mgnify:FL=1|jgi:hypothetical protein